MTPVCKHGGLRSDPPSCCVLQSQALDEIHLSYQPCWSRRERSRLQCRRPGISPWEGQIPWRRAWQPTPVFLPGEPHGLRSLVGCSPRGCKELDTTEGPTHINSLARLNLVPFYNLRKFFSFTCSVAGVTNHCCCECPTRGVRRGDIHCFHLPSIPPPSR